jgi:hypothetical protein
MQFLAVAGGTNGQYYINKRLSLACGARGSASLDDRASGSSQWPATLANLLSEDAPLGNRHKVPDEQGPAIFEQAATVYRARLRNFDRAECWRLRRRGLNFPQPS